MSKIDEIRTLLAEYPSDMITEVRPYHRAHYETYQVFVEGDCLGEAYMEGDAKLWAQSSSALRYLLTEVEKLQAEVAEEKKRNCKLESENMRYEHAVLNKYPDTLQKARQAAKACGYALAVHGSEVRDLDLIAIPWVEDCKPAEDVLKAIVGAVSEGKYWAKYNEEQDTDKPQGRRAHVILMGGSYIDLSIILPKQNERLSHADLIAPFDSTQLLSEVERLQAALQHIVGDFIPSCPQEFEILLDEIREFAQETIEEGRSNCQDR